MDRREVVVALIGVATLAVGGDAVAQTFDANPVDGRRFAETFADPAALDRTMLDVAYVHSWRTELAPRGYEADARWRNAAFENRQMIWQRLGDGRAAAMSSDAFNSGLVEKFEQNMLLQFKENIGAFSGFLADFGLSPTGKAADRILQSLHDYAILNVVALGQGADDSAKESFFWPFC